MIRYSSFKYAVLLYVCVLVLVVASSCRVLGSSSSEQASADTIRVMTYNIRHGEGVDGNVDLGRIADVITESKADVVALQEVDVGVDRSSGVDQLRNLSNLTGLENRFFGKNINHDGGEYGNAILSKFPIEDCTNTHLPNIHPEQRGIIQCLVDVGGKRVVVMNTHLDHREDDTERIESVRYIKDNVLPGYESMEIVMAGDFNDVPGSRVYDEVTEGFVDSWDVVGAGGGNTAPSDNPRSRIDYVFHTDRARAVSMRVIETLASDHRPALAEFVFD